MTYLTPGGADLPRTCKQFADEIALLDEPGPETPSRAAARAHLAECPRCQRQRESMLVTSAALRGHVQMLMAQAPTFTEAEIAARAARRRDGGQRSATPRDAKTRIMRLRIPGAAEAPQALISREARPSSSAWRRAISTGGTVAAAVLITTLLVATLTGRLPGLGSATRQHTGAPRATAVPLSALAVYAPGEPNVVAPTLSAFRASDGAPVSRFPVAAVSLDGAIFAQGVRYQLVIPNADVSDPAAAIPSTFSATRLSDGKSLWSEQIDVFSTPGLTLVDGVLYLDASAGIYTDVYAFRVSDGALLWKHALPASLRDGAPVVSNGVVYVVASASAFALRAKDGAVLWQRALQTGGQQVIRAWSTATGDTLYIYTSLASPSGQKDDFGVAVFALRLSDGAIAWHVELGTDVSPAAGPFAPVVADGVVYVRLAPIKFTSADDPLELFALRATDGATLWRYTSMHVETGNTGIPNIYPPAVSNGVVYVTEDGGNLTALSAADGHKIWRVNIDTNPSVDSYPFSITSPVVAYGVVFAIVNDSVVAVKASDGATLWRASCGPLFAPANYLAYHVVVEP